MKWYKPNTKFGSMMQKKYSQASMQNFQVLLNGQLYVDSSNNFQIVASDFIYSYNEIAQVLDQTLNIDPGSAPTANNTLRTFQKSCHAEYRYKNSSNCQAELDIYVMRVKQDCPLANTPGTAWNDGILDEDSGVSSARNNPYDSPFASGTFNVYYKPVKIFHNLLQPGQGCRLDMTVNLNSVINNEMLSGSNNDTGYFKKWTHVMMMVARGTPVSSSSSLGSGITKVGLSPVTIDYTGSKMYKYKLFSTQVNTWNYVAPTNGWAAPANELTYNQGSGATVAAVNI